MTQVGNRDFSEIWFVDFEFAAPPGEQPKVICLVACELASGRKVRLWQDQIYALDKPPYDIGENSLFVAYYASAEIGCHLALDWPLPTNILDLFAEFRNHTNGLTVACGSGLLGALVWYGLPSVDAAEKDSMRELAMRGGAWTDEEMMALLDYCESDVAALAKLLPAMSPKLDISRALLRGRFMKAAAQIEYAGVPLDTESLRLFRNYWTRIQDQLIAEIDARYGVFEGRTFKKSRFANWLIQKGIPWPRLPSGALALCDDTFKEMARAYPEVAPLRELRVSLSQMRRLKLAVGHDGRNRCLLSPFRSLTGRNQPKSSQFIFGPAVWLRGLIKPGPGRALAYIDWSQQEFGIAAALSKDPLMMSAYESGDAYLEFAKQAGAVPTDATADSHNSERAQFKQCALAVQYGMGAQSLAQRIGQPPIFARELINCHRRTYRKFWQWSEAALDYAMLHNRLWTVFGWQFHINCNTKPTTLRNYLMQANGAEMLRLACCMLVEAGICACAPVHDAILIEAPIGEIEGVVRLVQEIMEEASSIILDSFKLRSEAEIVRHPDRYMDHRGKLMWETVTSLIHRIES